MVLGELRWLATLSLSRQNVGEGSSFYVQKSQSGKKSVTIIVIFPGELERLRGRVH